MKIGWSLFLCVCVVAGVAAQAPVRDAAPTPVPTGSASLRGVVRDEGGRGLRRATVVISGTRLERSAITDDEGRFAFGDLPAIRFTIAASKPAYPSASYGASRPNRPGAGVLLGEGQQVNDIVITLNRGAVITGRVLDDHGQPMPGVPVMPWEIRKALSGERTLDFPATGGVATTTDDQGEFRFFGLPAGEYTVGTSWFYSGMAGSVRVPTDAEIEAAFRRAANPSTASAVAGASSSTPTPAYNYAAVFHPSSLDPMAATTVVLAAGEVRDGMDILMQFRPMSRIKVQLSGPADAIGIAEVSVARDSVVAALNTTTVSRTSPTGTYESPALGPGDYVVRIQAAANGARPPMWATRRVTLVDAEPVIAALELKPAMTVAGLVTFEATGDQLPPAVSTVRVSLLGVSTGAWGAVPAATPSDSGGFAWDRVFPARFRVNATVTGTAASTWTMKSVTVDGRDITDRPFDIGEGETPAIVVTMTDQIAELSGNLVDPDGRTSTDYFVVVVPADRAYWTTQSRRVVSARPDARGHYMFRGLPAGEYRIAATTDLVPQDLQQANTLDAIIAQSLPVTLGLGENKSLDIRVARR